MLRPITFGEWVKGYNDQVKVALKHWQQDTSINTLKPQEMDEIVLRQYIAYRNEIHSRQLVMATWGLASVTILLSIFTLVAK